jgi:hypothetical protein
MQAGIVLTSYGSALDPWNGPGPGPPSSPDIAVLEKSIELWSKFFKGG